MIILCIYKTYKIYKWHNPQRKCNSYIRTDYKNEK